MTTTTRPAVPRRIIAKTVEGHDARPRPSWPSWRTHPDLVALRSMRGEEPGQWDEWTCGGLRRPGRPGRGRAAAPRRRARASGSLLMMRNRPDFHWLDIAALSSCGPRPSASTTRRRPRRSQYLAGHAEAEDRHRRGQPGSSSGSSRCASELPELKKIFVIEPAGRRAARRRARRRPSCSARAASTSAELAAATAPTTWPPSSTRRAPPGRPRA